MVSGFAAVLRLAAARFLEHDGFALAGYIAFVGILSLLFFYYLGAIFIFGAEVNAVLDERNPSSLT